MTPDDPATPTEPLHAETLLVCRQCGHPMRALTRLERSGGVLGFRAVRELVCRCPPEIRPDS